MNIKLQLQQFLFLVIFLTVTSLHSQPLQKPPANVTISQVSYGWSNNSVNTTIFRKNSIVSDKKIQYTAFYNPEGKLAIARRKLGEENWEVNETQYGGNVSDAHNSISIMLDDDGYLHVSWDHHNNELRYAKSTTPYGLELTEKLSMTGKEEGKVTYPEFHKLPNGNLLFFYRSGASGNGNLVMNEYNLQSKTWQQIQSNLIDGQGQRNAYWQACVDEKGTIHVSWVWRETWDVSTNHDMCYAKSEDGGVTWTTSVGEKYVLPITKETAEVACVIPQRSELINQTSITTDKKGNPVIATYWREQDSKIPQFHLVYKDAGSWYSKIVSDRQEAFSLSGGGTKRIPISRPQVLVKGKTAMVIFRDEECGSRPSVYLNTKYPKGEWKVIDLAEVDLGSWEPSYDTELWRRKGILNLFVQKVNQVDGEGLMKQEPEMVNVLEWKP